MNWMDRVNGKLPSVKTLGESVTANLSKKLPSKKILKRMFFITNSSKGLKRKRTITTNKGPRVDLVEVKGRMFHEGYFTTGQLKGKKYGLMQIDKIIWKMKHGKTLDVVGHLDGDQHNNLLSNLYDPATDPKKLVQQLHVAMELLQGRLNAAYEELGSGRAYVRDAVEKNNTLSLEVKKLRKQVQRLTDQATSNKTQSCSTLVECIENSIELVVVGVELVYRGVSQTNYVFRTVGGTEIESVGTVGGAWLKHFKTGDKLNLPVHGFHSKETANRFLDLCARSLKQNNWDAF